MVLSKFLRERGFNTLHANCYETIHTWEPDCNKAIVVAVPEAFLFCLRTYATFYLITNLASKRDPRKIDWKRFARDVLQSSVFLCTNLIMYFWFLCNIRHALGFFTVFTFGGLSSMLASFCAILLEKKSRRPALALYLTNLASETLFHQLCNHGYMFNVSRGECIPFAVGLGLFMLLFTRGKLPPSIAKVLSATHKLSPDEDIIDLKKVPSDFHGMLSDLRTKFGKSLRCEHPHSCVSVSIEGFVKNFAVVFGASLLLTILRNLTNILKNPIQLVRLLLSRNNLKIPLFFGLLPLIFHGSRCLMNRYTNIESTARDVIAATLSGGAMLVWSNVTVAMYTLWKAIERTYYNLADSGKLPYIKHGDIILYSITTGYVLWQTVLEPQAIRKGYVKFLMGLSGNRIGMFNRELWREWGYDSAKLFPSVEPLLDSKHVTINPRLYQRIRPL